MHATSLLTVKQNRMKKKQNLFLSLIAVFSLSLFTSCSSDDNNSEQQIILDSGKETLTQNLFADETEGKNSVKFATTAAWTSSIVETTSKSQKEAAAASPEWISISPDRGDKAATYEIAIKLSSNYTGETRSATITIHCNGEEIKISILQKATTSDGVVPDAEKPNTEQLAASCKEMYKQVYAAWMQIDKQYSTLTSRQTVEPASSFLSDFWNQSYKCISYCNQLSEQAENSALSESEKNAYKALAFENRAKTHFYLKTLFGTIPLVINSDQDWSNTARAETQEIFNQIDADLSRVSELSTPSAENDFWLTKAVLHLQEGEANQAIVLLKNRMNQGDLLFRDTNGDGVFNEKDNNDLIMKVYLLLAEAYLKTGNLAEAAANINRINDTYSHTPIAQEANVIRHAIQSWFSSLNDTGMIFLNAVRWGDTQNWGKHKLLPIPQEAINVNPRLTQNPNW